MNRPDLYLKRKQWKYPPGVIVTLKKEIKSFYDRFNKSKPQSERIKGFNNETAFNELFSHVQKHTALEYGELPKTSWLQDFFNGLKDDATLTKSNVEALLTTFGWQYDPLTDKLTKRAIPSPAEDAELTERNHIIKFINSKTRKSTQLRELIGKYKYFAGARKEHTIHDYIYEHDLEIFDTGKTVIYNPFNHRTYLGFAVVTTNGHLQITSYDFDGGLLDGVGKLLSFRVNNYYRMAELIPGMGTSFDSDNRPIAAQALLSTDLSHHKKSPIIREYFDEVVPQLRMYIPEPPEVEKLIVKYH